MYKDDRTVFRLIDVAMFVGETDVQALSKKLNYYVGKGQLQNPRKGIYTKPGYNPEELACRLYSPSYISLEYVLQKAGVIFQFDTQITVVSYLSRSIKVETRSYRFRKIKGELLVNTTGLTLLPNHVNIAGPERAFLDMLYLSPHFYFDNLNPLDKTLLIKLLPIYQSKALTKRLAKILLDV
ncbi:MAG: hypothetical protein K8S16_14390 [Bacteroidales bacterium]|nr:hypothetical protein [Bacteroidales bacterium]